MIRREGWWEGEVGGIPKNVQAGERLVVGVSERKGRREGSTCASCQAALTGIIVAL